MEIQTLMKGHSCYTTCDNAQVTLRHVVVVVPVSTLTQNITEPDRSEERRVP